MVELLGGQTSGYTLLWEDNEYTLRNTPFKSTSDKKKDKEIIAYWWLQAYVPDGFGNEKTPYEIYRTWSNALYGFECVGPDSSYNPDTKQCSAKFCVEKDSDLQTGLEELFLILPLMKSLEEKGQKYKYFGVFERSLSEYGVYSVKYYDDLNIELGITVYGSYRILEKFTSPEALLKELQRKYYYE